MTSLSVSTTEQDELENMEEEEPSLNYKVIQKWRCCQLSPSAHLVYFINTLFFVTVSINSVAVNAILSSKFCYVKFENSTLCTNKTFTSNYPDIQQKVAAWSNYNALAQIPLTMIVSQMLSFYCGNVGHKLPFLLPMFGSFLATLYLAVLATPQFIGWNVGSIFGYSILYSMLGNTVLVQMASFSYVALISAKEKRIAAMVICEGTILIGTLVGSLINGPIIDVTSLSTLMYINAGFTFLPVIIVVVFLTDVSSSAVPVENYKWKDVIGINRIADAFKCIGKEREGNGRLLLILGLIMYTAPYVAVSGSSQLSYLYFVQEKGMSMTQYSIYQGYVNALKGLVYPVVLFVLKKRFNVDTFHILMVSTAAAAFGFVIMSINAIPYNEWIGGGLSGTYIIIIGLTYAFLINLCGKNELGNLFAFIGLINLVFGTVFSVIFQEFYSATLSSWPASFMAVCAFLLFVGEVFTAVIDKLRVRK